MENIQIAIENNGHPHNNIVVWNIRKGLRSVCALLAILAKDEYVHNLGDTYTYMTNINLIKIAWFELHMQHSVF